MQQLIGENPDKGGDFFTVWASRQCGKSTLLGMALRALRADERFHVAKVNLQVVGEEFLQTVNYILEEANAQTGLAMPNVSNDKEFERSFLVPVLDKPLVLILDEFDSLAPEVIAEIVQALRNIYIARRDDARPMTEKVNLLHSVALIGVRAVVGVENKQGSPFNVQRSVHVPHLTLDEVRNMFDDYREEHGQEVEPEVVDRLYYETNGQPGLVSFFGELLTEPPPLRYNEHRDRPIGLPEWDRVFGLACFALPDNNILNLISKANQPEYKPTVLDMFRTSEKVPFAFDQPEQNFLYMNGVITYEESGPGRFYAKFPCPYVQKRLFNRFSGDLTPSVNPELAPLEMLEDVFSPEGLRIDAMLRRYEKWLADHPGTFAHAPTRSDGRVFEAVYHFHLYHYLQSLIRDWDGRVWPEFPTGNGKIDLIFEHEGQRYALELKSYSSIPAYRKAIGQAAAYARQLELPSITLGMFIESASDEVRAKLEKQVMDDATGVSVNIVFMATATR